MTPLKGVVIAKGACLVAQLTSGAHLDIHTEKDFCVGDPIWIRFDYTRGMVAGVWTETERYFDGDPGSSREGLWPYPGFDPDNDRPPIDPTI